ncbi:hypothetical protein ABK040_009535 [Willaertia magna]
MTTNLSFFLSLLSILFFFIALSQQQYEPVCYGFNATSQSACVGNLGTCLYNNKCSFPSVPDYFYAVGKNDKKQFNGTLSLSTGRTKYAEQVYTAEHTLYYISKMASTHSLIIDFNGEPVYSGNDNTGLEDSLISANLGGEVGIAFMGDDNVTAVVTVNSKVFVRGSNLYNNLGLNTETKFVHDLTLMSNSTNDISINSYSGCSVVYSNGNYDLITFGLINYALLNNTVLLDENNINSTVTQRSSLLPRNLLVDSSGNFDVLKCEVTKYNLLLLKDNGDLYIYGFGSNITELSHLYNCGDKQCIDWSKSLVKNNVKTFKCSFTGCALVTNDNKVFTWGQNNNGQLCSAEYGWKAPTQLDVPFSSNIVQVTITKNNLYILNDDGFVYGCGANTYGQMGTPNFATNYNALTRIVIPGQRYKIWQLADGIDSEYLLMFPGMNCTDLYGGEHCSLPLFNCYGKDVLSACGNGTCAMNNTCFCNDGYAGNECQFPKCFDFDSNQTAVCNSHGQCVAPNSCKCQEKWTGSMCEKPICYGYSAPDINLCNGNGSCIAPDTCQCNSFWTGNNCSIPLCGGVPANETSVCTAHGYTGPICATAQCYGYDANSSRVCSGRGICLSPDHCNCNYTMFQGDVCQYLDSSIEFSFDFTSATFTGTSLSAFTLVKTTNSEVNQNIFSTLYMKIVYTAEIITSQQSSIPLSVSSASFNQQQASISLSESAINNIPLGNFDLKITANITGLVGYNKTNPFVITKRFRKDGDATPVVTLDKSSPVILPKSATISLNAYIRDSYYTQNRLNRNDISMKWYYTIGSVTKTSGSKTQDSPLTFTYTGNANEVFAEYLTSSVSNITVSFKFVYQRYAGEPENIIAANTKFVDVVILNDDNAPLISIETFPRLQYLLASKVSTISTKVSFTNGFPSGMTLSYLWTLQSTDTALDISAQQNNPILILPPGSFKNGVQYTFVSKLTTVYNGITKTYETQFTGTGAPLLPTYSESTQVIKVSPGDGSGTALITPHTFVVAALPLNVGDNRALTYTLYYKLGDSSAPLSRLSQGSLTTTSTLPAGNITLSLGVTDEYGNSLVAGSLRVSTQSISAEQIKESILTRSLSVEEIEQTAATLNQLEGDEGASIREKLAEQLATKLDLSKPMETTVAALTSLTSKSDQITSKTSSLMLNTIKTLSLNIKDSVTSGTTSDTSGVAGSLGETLSNIADASKNGTDVGKNITSVFEVMTSQLAAVTLPTQQLSITTKNFNVLIRTETSFSGKKMSPDNGTDVGVDAPTDMDDYLDEKTSDLNSGAKTYSVIVMNYKSTGLFDNVKNGDGSQNRTGTILEFSVVAQKGVGEDTVPVKIENLQNALNLSFVVETSGNHSIPSGYYETFACKYINEEDNTWSDEGCKLSSVSGNKVVCSCDHATKFSTFRLYAPATSLKEQIGNRVLTILEIIFGAIYCTAAIAVFIGLLVLRNSNPVKSRYIGPHVGLFAIIFDTCIISFAQGIAKLVLEKPYDPSAAYVEDSYTELVTNIFGYINTILVIPLYLTAFFTFLVQIIRYFLKRNMYSYMVSKKLYNRTFYRYITSKTAFWITLIIALTVTISYYAIWVGLQAGSKLVNGVYSYVTSMTYFGFAWIFAICVAIIACWDLFYMNRHLLSNCLTVPSKEGSGGENAGTNVVDLLIRTKKQKMSMNKSTLLTVPQVYYITDDNLYFRLEMHTFILAFVALTGNYIAGIIDTAITFNDGITNPELRLAPRFIGFVFGVIYTFLLIAAFGGLVVVCFLIENKGRVERKNEKKAESKDEDDSNEVVQLLRHKAGRVLFTNFCQKEFSIENLFMFDDINLLKKDLPTIDLGTKRQRLNEMNDKYVKTGAETEVNLPGAAKKNYIELNNKMAPTDEEILKVLEAVYIAVMYNLKDTFGRFCITEDYETFEEASKNSRNIEMEFL